MTRSFKKLATLFGAVLFLTGCYLPGTFDAEIELSRTGLYKMTYDGYIIDLTLFQGIQQKKMSKKEQDEKIKTIINDFKRDKSTKQIKYFRQGAFQVTWSKGGDIVRARQVVFFRRNQNILSVTYDKEKATMKVRGKYIKKQDADRLAAQGLDVVRGFLRVVTDAQVLSHNAIKVTDKGRTKIYGWEIKSIYDRAPQLVIALR